jgi:hypothetical protein
MKRIVLRFAARVAASQIFPLAMASDGRSAWHARKPPRSRMDRIAN